MNALQMDPAMMVAAAVVGLGLLGLLVEALMSSMRRVTVGGGKSPLGAISDVPHPAAPVAQAAAPQVVEVARAPEPVAEAAPEPPKDPLAENRRFFTTLGAALSASDEEPPVELAALHANLSADVFMERMTLATKAWRADGFAVGARQLLLKADGTPPDVVATKVLEGYEQLKAGRVKEALEAFLAAIDAAKVAAAANAGSPWPHAWSAFAWRGLALIAEEAGDTQATLAGLKVAYQSMVNAFEITVAPAPAALAEAA